MPTTTRRRYRVLAVLLAPAVYQRSGAFFLPAPRFTRSTPKLSLTLLRNSILLQWSGSVPLIVPEQRCRVLLLGECLRHRARSLLLGSVSSWPVWLFSVVDSGWIVHARPFCPALQHKAVTALRYEIVHCSTPDSRFSKRRSGLMKGGHQWPNFHVPLSSPPGRLS